MKTPTSTKRKQFRKALQHIADRFDPHMQLSTLLTLLVIAEAEDAGEPLSTADLVIKLGLSNASASRNTYYWGDGTQNVDGSGMIEIRTSRLDRRRREFVMSKSGKALLYRLEETLGEKS